MSGGVDSSVAAALMPEQGYECMGAAMRLFRKPDPLHSSMALTMLGQEVIELLEIKGLKEEREC